MADINVNKRQTVARDSQSTLPYKEDVSNKTSDYTATGIITYPNSQALYDAINYVRGLIPAVTPTPVPDWANAVEVSTSSSKTIDGNTPGWIILKGLTYSITGPSNTHEGYLQIRINNKSIRDYFIPSGTGRSGIWSNKDNFKDEIPIRISNGNTVSVSASSGGFTLSSYTLRFTFVPQK